MERRRTACAFSVKPLYTHPTMKLQAFYESLRADIAAIAAAYGIDPATHDPGKTGLKTMNLLLTCVQRNRAYGDDHPAFASGHWRRVLPCDGRDYCFLYVGDANDTHVATLLRKIKASFEHASPIAA
jgi:hypothetical protein